MMHTEHDQGLMTIYEPEVRVCVRCHESFTHRNIGMGSERVTLCWKCSHKNPHEGGVIKAGEASGVYVESPTGLLGTIHSKRWKAGEPIWIRWENSEVREYPTSTGPIS